ncbi:peptidylprolyl isomerase [Chrysiogenes arsenatis]|uniref:peptidylprolyl isomerase n=1 Tax=Chrysiogenes arsenatis TaxID=309797 RepID=UPI0003FFB0C3|nr:peptidylprolyl isomerase [Chrysiogenes arsenatis]
MKKSLMAVALSSALLIGPYALASQSSVLATVGKMPITQEDFNRSFESLPPQVQAQLAQSPDQKSLLLDELVKQRLVYLEAEKAGYAKNKKVLERLESIKKDLMVGAFVEEYLEKNAKVSEKDMEAFYKENQAQFVEAESVNASHILLKDEAKAKQILAEAKKPEVDFSELAKQHSEEPGAATRGGKLGDFGRGQMVPEFEKAAFEGSIGVVPELVQTKFGYHILKINSKNPARTVPYAEVKEQISHALENRAKGEALEKLVKELELKHSVKLYKDNLK